MNRLVIVGNGFDLAHGLNTRYSDFILWLLKKHIGESRANRDFDFIIWKIKGRNKGDYSWLDEFISFPSLNANLSQKGIKLDISGHLTKLVTEHVENFNWVDIEGIYYNELVKYSENTEVVLGMHREMEFIKRELGHFISQQNEAFILDPKSEIAFNYFDIFKQNVLTHDEIKLYRESGLLDTTAKIEDTYLLNFNYSNVLRQYWDYLDQNRFKIIHIHGYANNIDSIVFGVGDEFDGSYLDIENRNNNELLRFVKSFKYMQNSEYRKLISFIESDKDFEVVILGHSLGLTDRTMLNHIFERDNLKQVRIYYYDADLGSDFVERTYQLSRHFTRKSRMRTLVVPQDESAPMPQINT